MDAEKLKEVAQALGQKYETMMSGAFELLEVGDDLTMASSKRIL